MERRPSQGGSIALSFGTESLKSRILCLKEQQICAYLPKEQRLRPCRKESLTPSPPRDRHRNKAPPQLGLREKHVDFFWRKRHITLPQPGGTELPPPRPPRGPAEPRGTGRRCATSHPAWVWGLPGEAGLGGSSFSRSLPLSRPPSHFLCLGKRGAGRHIPERVGGGGAPAQDPGGWGQMSEGDSWSSPPPRSWLR